MTATTDSDHSVKGASACSRYMMCVTLVGASRPESCSISVIGYFLPREELLVEAQLRKVGHALRIQDAIEVVALVLHDARMEAVRLALERIALDVEAGIAQLRVAGHDAAHAGHREA